MDDIKAKINELFKEEENRPQFSNVTEVEEFTKEEKQEIEDYLRKIRERAPTPPKQIWHWNFWGIILLIGLAYFLEFALFFGIIYLAIPYAINISWMTLGKAFVLTCLIYFIRIWKNVQLFKFFTK